MAIHWSREEVEAAVADYFAMLAAHLSGVSFNKAAHRRTLVNNLPGRSEQSIEFKHANISAVLLELGFPFIPGYKPRANYQVLLYEVVSERLASDLHLQAIAAADADRPVALPEVNDILGVVTKPPAPRRRDQEVGRGSLQNIRPGISVNYIGREARNRSLGAAGEIFVLNFERARLLSLGKEVLAGKIEHTSRLHGDGAGYDILSYEVSGVERLIEVKTTK